MRTRLRYGLLIIGLLINSGCTATPTSPPLEPAPLEPVSTEPASFPSELPEVISISSPKPRLLVPNTSQQDLQELVNGNNRFAFDLYQTIRDFDGNLFYSPYSISLALAMTYAGARGQTASQMVETLHFLLPPERLHPAFNQLDLTLHSRGKNISEESGKGFTLNIVNALWGQDGYAFFAEFLDLLAENYGAGLRLVDFVNEPESSRLLINDWVLEQTHDRIKDLIPEGVITDLTRLVLANAIYFQADWSSPFEKGLTHDGQFSLLDGSKVSVPMMNQTVAYNYTRGQDFQALELPYLGYEMSMVILHPDPAHFIEFEKDLDAGQLETIVAQLESTDLQLSMPKFEYEMNLPLAKVLQDMGIEDAFKLELADFSGMDGRKELYIQDVLHKAFVAVDEKGTEAAAATAIVVGVESAPVEQTSVKIDSPFIFLIRDMETGSILFLGRVLNPLP